MANPEHVRWVEEVTKAHPDSRVHCYLDQFADFRGCRASISLPREYSTHISHMAKKLSQ